MKNLGKILNHPYAFWALLSIPAMMMLNGVMSSTDPKIYHQLLHPTGEFSARFMIIAMMLTPLAMLLPGRSWIMWLQRRRRYLGVAAFGYALLHLVFYVIDLGALKPILDEALKLGIWTGWLAFFIFVPLALTSNDWSTRKLKKAWKPLQRWVYVAAVATLVHWIFVEYNIGPALVHFVPLAAIEAYRMWRNWSTVEKRKFA